MHRYIFLFQAFSNDVGFAPAGPEQQPGVLGDLGVVGESDHVPGALGPMVTRPLGPQPAGGVGVGLMDYYQDPAAVHRGPTTPVPKEELMRRRDIRLASSRKEDKIDSRFNCKFRGN